MSGARDAAPHARFAARAAGLRAAHLRRMLVILGGAVLAGVLVWLVAFSPVFAVRSVTVTGAPGDLAGHVRARADDAIGTPMVRTDTAAIDRSVRQLPAVRNVDVSRSLMGDLEVQVRPRVSVLVVKSGKGRMLVDGEGVAFAKATDEHAAQLPTVTVKSADTSRQDVAAVATVMAAIPEKDREDVADLRVDRTGQVTFTLNRLAVSWGNSAQSKEKAEALRTMRPIALEDGSRNLDLSSPKRPVLT